ncbi:MULTISPECIES: Fe-S cluster assembly scaffold SufA [Kluyvera]|jgi:FeS assembly scaffold SufA|uniref:Fe-S cluster assembly scaffold SufA n=1 Tax=Kluyvera ascorbata TaxID=51288 RepID=A0A378GJ41_9ENTR|nr:Fe-S cluster assembly scaffold SufA [Kluyvera ascorbata]BBV65762.1 (Fe-S)-cluster assembly protein [Klebsiella sp. STW0522-44]EJG2384993.1 Fe-S cluster assembly scaffold SufA [Kluyvera ascorbata]KFC92276.1 SufA family iron-sulfur cluster assembly iron binding protein [Kluyvera ascorbata ATCC 33433]MDT8701916.1 Fe-S cluster assembly scaffold SufA [Kluyvera ascorbata]MDU1197895.1 Fe-S cluster assembly scaffold SufA [Kluyvera ascorbata]
MDLHSGTFDPNDVSWRGITLTPSAAAHIRELVKQQPGIQGVRLGVKQTGCAGFGYVLDAVNEPDKDDLLFEADGAKLWVPLSAMPFIDGTEVDYVREGLNQLFKYHNPKAQNECGCGESFGV